MVGDKSQGDVTVSTIVESHPNVAEGATLGRGTRPVVE